MFAEEIEMFVMEPIFHGSLQWNSPIVPVLFMFIVFLPISFVVIKYTYFGSNSY